ncbi:unnamed protein product, partial [Closterium sp. Naga37s-1]
MYMASMGITRPPFWQMCAFIMLGTNGATWFNTAVLVTCIRNFEGDRGVVVGLLKGFIGLSGAIFTQLSELPPPLPPSLYLMCTWHGTGPFSVQVVGVGLALYLMLAMTLQWFKAGRLFLRHLKNSFTPCPPAFSPSHSLIITPSHSLIITPSHSLIITPSHSLIITPSLPAIPFSGTKHGAPSLPSCLYIHRTITSTNFPLPPPPLPSSRLPHARITPRSLMTATPLEASRTLFSLDTVGSPLKATSFTSTPASHSGAGRASERAGSDVPHTFDTSTPASDMSAGWASDREGSPRERGGGGLGQAGSSAAGSGLGVGVRGNGGGVGGCGEGGREGKSMEVEGRSSRAGGVEVGRGQRGSALRVGMDHTLLQAAVTPEYWLLFFAMGCGTGSGLTAINNLAQVAESLGSASVGALVALVSIWNFLGRMAAGYVSEQCLKLWSTPRPLCMLLVQAAMGCAHLLFSIGDPLLLYPAAALVGAAHGAHWTLMVTTASELFGLKYFGALYNTLSISSTVGSYCLSVKLAGYIYDRQSVIQRSALLHLPGLSSSASSLASASLSPPTTTTVTEWAADAAGQQGAAAAQLLLLEGSELPHRCMGPDCFRLTFLVMALVCVAGICALLNLVSRTRRLYQ